MGGHGGLNILPQKRWNVYNFDNREKVRQDEEAAAKEEQLKREQSRKRDAEFRLEQLRTARGLAPVSQGKEEPAAMESNPAAVDSKSAAVGSKSAAVESKPGHINLFEGVKFFYPIKGLENEGGEGKDGFKKNKKMKKEEAKPRVVTAEDEKYRLGYGVAGKGVKLPWYLDRLSADANEESAKDDESSRADKEKKNKSGKKTLEELREERLEREKREKERERTLILNKSRKDGAAFKDRGFYRR
ncbi:leukocyte receptor cluster member 1-like [Pyrus ussuriensis x Pyrus communis]|uniref:Leukocyte receptor cluster member 1-like n=1 Tax=Pyrus ussuriensis x Pyrus communis TaxID=2448454 RepID=A0A5N5H6R6_9ROSA|nr:leukocyte receptor cluster member 1-like [Pyrus ussuriensis x Pyrus communis]